LVVLVDLFTVLHPFYVTFGPERNEMPLSCVEMSDYMDVWCEDEIKL